MKGVSIRHANFFSAKPLNYETFCQRLGVVHRRRTPPSPQLVTDCIVAARTLEREAAHTRRIEPKARDFLSIRRSHSTYDVESKLEAFLRRYQAVVCHHDSVLKAYLLVKPTPSNSESVVEMVSSHYIMSAAQSPTLVMVALRLLLHEKDYRNSFVLIDRTVSSQQNLGLQRSATLGVAAAVAGVSLVSAAVATSLSAIFIGATWVTLGLALKYALYRVHAVRKLDRVSWRPHCGAWYRYARTHELYMVNKIIAHYEEHTEVNVRNYHHSNVRHISKLNTFHRNDYVLELPEAQTVTAGSPTEIETLFRSQLNLRRMVLNDLQEELMFLDYWLTQGEDYEWVEPDQDPAEVIKLRTQ
ncbi:Uncharacterized protein ABC855_g1647 [[Candida] zeylanoides]